MAVCIRYPRLGSTDPKCSGFISRVRDISSISLDAQLCASKLPLIALDSYVRFASSCVLVVCGRSSDQSFVQDKINVTNARRVGTGR